MNPTAHGHAHSPADGPLPAMDEAFWDARYGEADAIWSGHPNAVLVSEVADLTPGSALDVGCGEGGDAIWLAQRGWRVTGAEISSVALRRAATHAGTAGVTDRVTWVHTDLTGTVPDARFDLVTAHYMHLPGEQRRRLHRRLAELVSPGGTLLVVGHHPSDHAVVPRPHGADLYFTAADVAAVLDPDRWTVLVDDERPRPAVHPNGHPITLHDAVLKARRRPQYSS